MRTTAQWYEDFARQTRARSSAYSRLATAVAGDAATVALIERLPEQQRQPPLVFAVARMLGAPLDTDAGYLDFLASEWGRLEAECLARPMQTNEPGRCAALLPALGLVPGPIALLELGASAGLCLFVDRYSYRYELPGGRVHRVDPLDGESGVVLDSEVRAEDPSGAGRLPDRLPEIVWRAGIDLAPLDVTTPADREWLEALVWPGEEDRLDRVRAATAIASAAPPRILDGDARERLAELAAEAPREATLVIVTAGVMVYIPYLARQSLAAQIRGLDARWVSLEGSTVLPEVAARCTGGPAPGRFVLALDEHPLAYVGPHGESIEWMGPESQLPGA